MATDEKWNPEPFSHAFVIFLGGCAIASGLGGSVSAWFNDDPFLVNAIGTGLMLFAAYLGVCVVQVAVDRRKTLRTLRAGLDRIYEIREAATPTQLVELERQDRHYVYGRHRSWT
jgi:hypothetical protein